MTGRVTGRVGVVDEQGQVIFLHTIHRIHSIQRAVAHPRVAELRTRGQP